MKKYFSSVFLCTALLLTACKKKNSNPPVIKNSVAAIASTPVALLKNRKLPVTYLDSINYKLKITEAQFNALQLHKMERFKDLKFGEENASITIADTLYNNGKAKVLLIVDNTGGELAGYLVSYDINGNYVSDTNVLYEDIVEYYSTTSSVVHHDTIRTQIINTEYTDDEKEKKDTVNEVYVLTKNMVFKKLTHK